MELLIIIILLFGVPLIWRGIRAAGKASYDVTAGKSDSFGESFSAQFGGLGEFQSKVEESTKTFSPEGSTWPQDKYQPDLAGRSAVPVGASGS